jgi:methionyl-tRNA synthetase
MKTVLHVAAQAVSDARTLLSPFLPHSAQTVHEIMGGTGTVSPQPEIREVDDLDGGPGYPVLMGDYRRREGAGEVGTVAPWQPVPVTPGTAIGAPKPVFRKLDDSIVEEELERLRAE